MQSFIPERLNSERLSTELLRSHAYARNDFAAIESGLDLIERGDAWPKDGMRPHQFALLALNTHSGIICGSLELMKYEFPSESDEAILARVRELLVRGKHIAQRVMKMLGMGNVRRTLRRFSCKFRELFTPGWLKSRGYTEQQRERVLNAASSCARRFLRWLANLLARVEATFVVDELRTITLGTWARHFVKMCDRAEGLIVIRTGEGKPQTFEISPRANQAWRVIRLLMESNEEEGLVSLPANALALFRNTDSANTLIRNDLAAFARHIHPTSTAGVYHIQPFTKRAYAH